MRWHTCNLNLHYAFYFPPCICVIKYDTPHSRVWANFGVYIGWEKPLVAAWWELPLKRKLQDNCMSGGFYCSLTTVTLKAHETHIKAEVSSADISCYHYKTPTAQLALKCPLIWRKPLLQARGAQKCRGLIFYKSYLASIKSQMNFLLLMVTNKWVEATYQNHPVCTLTSLPTKSLSSNPTKPSSLNTFITLPSDPSNHHQHPHCGIYTAEFDILASKLDTAWIMIGAEDRVEVR